MLKRVVAQASACALGLDRMMAQALACGALLVIGHPAWGWNATGHRIAAAITYDHLSPNAKARVDALLAMHPDYAALLARDAPSDPPPDSPYDKQRRARAAFLAASVWPDTIRIDKRFYDDTQENALPTPLLPGFPSMARHTNWHYIDIAISREDGSPLQPTKSPNSLTELRRILKSLRASGSDSVYDLPWLIHIEEDVHQPLHCVSRFVKSQPEGDGGGNKVYVRPGRTLHAAWDGAAGSDSTDAYVNRMASELAAEFASKHNSRVSKDPKKWIEEGVELAKHEVYTFGVETGSPQHPVVLTEQYETNMRHVARERLALAGFRLAAVLNEKLK
ncbi:MAG TPA: S1/P1 nuclease [Candidatus Acidoferrum sp.]